MSRIESAPAERPAKKPGEIEQTDLSGSPARLAASARAGFLPVKLARTPLAALEGISIYLRSPESENGYRLYRQGCYKFGDDARGRLLSNSVEFIYIQMSEQSRLRKQLDAHLVDAVADPAMAIWEKSNLLYDTSVELVHELMTEPDFASRSPRLERVSKAVATFVLNEPSAFSHLFAASHHDFYTTTHMVNVSTWMVCLAYAMGYRDPENLNQIAQAGLLHDMGKLYIPEDVLNKPGKLTDEEWAKIRKHPELGCDHLQRSAEIDPLVLTVTRQHHERLDGSGYPDGLKGEDIHPMSRLCAVVDSFDAMTALRPFKERALTVSEALTILEKETPSKYDSDVMEAWLKLLAAAERDGAMPTTFGHAAPPTPQPQGEQQDPAELRRHPRFRFMCPARAHVVEHDHGSWREREGVQVTTHNISRCGLGFLSQTPFEPGQRTRVYLLGLESGKVRNKVFECQVMRCREYTDGWHDIGGEFASLDQ